jgi:hypothetical protein
VCRLLSATESEDLPLRKREHRLDTGFISKEESSQNRECDRQSPETRLRTRGLCEQLNELMKPDTRQRQKLYELTKEFQDIFAK